MDLVDLPSSVGLLVRVGGLIASVDAEGITLDDGTATAVVDVTGAARSELLNLFPGRAVNFVGVAGAGPEPRVTVARVEDIFPVADLAGLEDPTGPAGSADGLPAPNGPVTAIASNPFGLSRAALNAPDPASPPVGSVILLVGLLLSLASVGVVALLLGRRTSHRPMARPVSGTRG